ncbi:MAG: aspartyl protease family protein [Pyrinomonadaceae bacterium]
METIEFAESYQYDTRLVGIIVPTFLNYGGKIVEIKTKIDTGSSYCIFQRKHAENLGIDVERGEYTRISTATSGFDAYGFELSLSVLDIETVSTVYFAKEESFTRNVLGRQGWLDRVKLGLIDYEGKLLLSAYEQ